MPLPDSPPVLNRQAAEKNKAAQAIHLQGQMKAGAAPTTTDTLSKLGAAFTKGQAQQDVAAAGSELSQASREAEQGFGQSVIDQRSQNLKEEEQLQSELMEQQNKLVDMNIGITRDEFLDEQQLQSLEASSNFQNETQLADLARVTIGSDEEFRGMLQDAEQQMQEKLRDDEWELSVYDRALKDKTLMSQISKDRALAREIQLARDAANEKIKQGREKAAKMQKVVGAAKIAGGAAMTAYGVPGGTGVAMSGAQDVGTADGGA